MTRPDRIAVRNVIRPTSARTVDAAMYTEMRRAMLEVLPRSAPGVTLVTLREMILPQLSAKLFPGGAKAGWWLKTVQLDLEGKGTIARTRTSPLRLHKA